MKLTQTSRVRVFASPMIFYLLTGPVALQRSARALRFGRRFALVRDRAFSAPLLGAHDSGSEYVQSVPSDDQLPPRRSPLRDSDSSSAAAAPHSDAADMGPVPTIVLERQPHSTRTAQRTSVAVEVSDLSFQSLFVSTGTLTAQRPRSSSHSPRPPSTSPRKLSLSAAAGAAAAVYLEQPHKRSPPMLVPGVGAAGMAAEAAEVVRTAPWSTASCRRRRSTRRRHRSQYSPHTRRGSCTDRGTRGGCGGRGGGSSRRRSD